MELGLITMSLGCSPIPAIGDNRAHNRDSGTVALIPVYTRHGVIVISNRNRGHDYDYDCELVIVIDYIHGKYNVIAIVIDYFTKVIEIMITYHDYMIFFPSFCITVTYIL